MNSKLLTTTLDIDSITSERLRKEFDETELERLAKAIISSGGIINPILVRELSPIKYEVIEGHFEYYAAVKASEIKPTFAEIRAIVLSKDLELNDGIREQIDILRKKELSTAKDIPIMSEQDNKSDYDRLEKLLLDRFSQLEAKITPPQPPSIIDLSRIEQLLVSHQQSIIASLNKDIPTDTVYLTDRIAEQLQRQINTLEVFHEDNVKTIRHLKAELQNANKKPIDRIEKFIDDLNKLSLEELKTKFDRYGIQKKSIASSANKVINLRPFTSLIDIKKALSDATIVRLLNQWE